MLAKPILLAKPVEGRSPVSLSVTEVRAIVLRSQRLAEDLLPFGLGKTAVLKAIQHLAISRLTQSMCSSGCTTTCFRTSARWQVLDDRSLHLQGTQSAARADGSKPTGRSFTFQGVSIIRVEGDKIRSDQCR